MSAADPRGRRIAVVADSRLDALLPELEAGGFGTIQLPPAGLEPTVVSEWLDPAENARNIAWARESYDIMRPSFTPGRYVNYLGDDDGEDAVAAAYGPNYQRLRTLKAKYDPTNLFHLNQKVNRGERLYLRAHKPDGTPIESTAIVIRVAPAIYGTARVGVQIAEPTDNWLRLFVSWVADEQPTIQGDPDSELDE